MALGERAVGPDHPDIANLLITLASIAEAQGDYTAAAQQAQRAVAIMEQVTGSDEIALLHIQALNSLATISRLQGRYNETEALCQQGVAFLQRRRVREKSTNYSVLRLKKDLSGGR